ncbi:hypothetical protein [uncultured Flavobacterium sp.]|uniref:hypothetical protein n=1 Tax=uncultured Flavobacterium sp. TaxID=165435 RepID=UPI0025D0F1D0|nr:hypothetical protein [uncultured Flavobacterium sp.]
MNKLYLAVIVVICLAFTQNRNDFDFKILNKSLKAGDSIMFDIKNNTKESYCFLIDISFSCVEYPEYYYKNSFFAPRIELYNKDNMQVNELIFTNSGSADFSKEEKSNGFNKILGISRSICGNLKLFTIKPNEILHFKIPLSFVNYLDDNTFKYYVLKRNEYYLQINYLQGEKFINERLSKEKRDSISNKGIKFFNGQLKSNRVKLKINVEEYNTALLKLKKN